MTAEQNICDGRTLLGVVRDRSDASVVAVVDEQVLAPFNTIAAATDAVLHTIRLRVAP